VLGAGAAFTVDIPLVRVAAASPSAAAQHGGTLAAARLLLVEANPLSQSILRAVLASKVASVTVVGNAEEAQVTLAGVTIDLLLMDANTLGKDIALAGALAQPVTAAGGRAVILWPTPDDEIHSAAETAGITKLLGTPLAAPDLVTALGTLYGPTDAPAEIAA
jgi:CheY-like chemotaxis protein